MIDKFAYGRINSIDGIRDYKPVETYAVFIQDLVKTTNCRKYLELGVDNGYNIKYIRDHVEKCVGVDVYDKLQDKNNIEYHLMTTDNFFNNNNETFDIIFIDANHDWRYVRRDFENSLKVLNEFGIIILHDTDPIHEVMIHTNLCSDSYHIFDYVYSIHPELDIINLPICDMGLSLVKRKKDRRVSKYL
jgi:predicted O-methyltransferase YrrM